MSESQPQDNRNIDITVPLSVITEMYSKIKETDPIYSNKELQGKAIIAGKNITLFKFKPRLKLKKNIEITPPTTPNGRPELTAQAWFHFSPIDDEKTQDEEYDKYPDDLAKPRVKEVKADLEISIDQNKGRIQINPKYAVLEVKVKIRSGNSENGEEPFCQLTIPMQLEKLKVDLPLGNSKFSVPFPAPINRTFVNSGSEFPIQGTIKGNSIIFKYPIVLEEQEK
jgi:hypothetical protein